LLESLSHHELAPAVFDPSLRHSALACRRGRPSPGCRAGCVLARLGLAYPASPPSPAQRGRVRAGRQPRASIVIDDAAATALDQPATPPAPGRDHWGDRCPRLSGTAERSNPRHATPSRPSVWDHRTVAALPWRADNLLFISGGVGLGQTPLLHAVSAQRGRLCRGMVVV